MGLLFYYIPRSQTTPPKMTYFPPIQVATIWLLQLKNTKIFWKKLIESGKITKILEYH